MRVTPLLTVLALSLVASLAGAQGIKKEQEVVMHHEGGPSGGSITDGVNQWDLNAYSTTTGGSTDFEVPIGSDHQFSTWWWYRVDGDTQETLLPPPDLEDFTGDTAVITWFDVDSRGLFSAMLTVTIADASPGAILSQTLAITNLTGGTLSLQVFHYNDMDMDQDAADDGAAEFTSTQMVVADVSAAHYHGVLSDNYQVDTFPVVRTNLTDDDIDDFASTGLPFGPADFTAGFQRGAVLGAASTRTFEAGICVNTATTECLEAFFFGDDFESGDTSAWDTVVD